MQALLMILLVSFIMAGMGSVISTISTTTVKMRESQIDDVNHMFRDIDYAVTNIILQQNSNIVTKYPGWADSDGNLEVDTADIPEIAQFLPWSIQELTTDPWGEPYVVITAQDATLFSTVFADAGHGGANEVFAPMRVYALISGGVNRKIDTNIAGANDYRKINALEPQAGSDDIIYTFSTRAAMMKYWNRIYNDLDNKVIPAITSFYQQQYKRFQPVIKYAYGEILTKGQVGEATSFLENWHTYGPDRANNIPDMDGVVRNTFATIANMQQYIGGAAHSEGVLAGTYYYPDINGVGVEEFGIEDVTDKWAPFLLTLGVTAIVPPALDLSTVDEDDVAKDSTLVDMSLDSLSDAGLVNEWDITFDVTVQGKEN